MIDSNSDTVSHKRAVRNVTVLVIAQAFLGAQMPLIFTIGGLAGQSLASNVCFATLPISMIVLGSMLSATPVSSIMQNHGRRVGFWLGTLGGAIGAAICVYALYVSSFPLLLVGSFSPASICPLKDSTVLLQQTPHRIPSVRRQSHTL